MQRQIGIYSDREDMDQRIKSMNAVNAVLIIVAFIAFCRADDDVCSVSCEDVTGTVGKEVTFTCSVSQKCSKCCIIKYKFHNPDKQDSTICRHDPPKGSCEHRNSFTCRYTPTTAMTEKLGFFFQTTCDMKKTEFSVNITEASKQETVTEAPHRGTLSPTGEHLKSMGDKTVSKGTVVAAVVGCFFILIIIIMAIIYKRNPNYIKPSQLQWVFLGRRQDQNPQHAINTDSTV